MHGVVGCGVRGEMARIIHEVQPRYVFVENSPMLTSRGLGRVLGDLASMGFDARWGVLGAADVGAVHQRYRIWIVGKQMAHTLFTKQRGNKWQSQNEKNVSREMAHAHSTHEQRNKRTKRTQAEHADINGTSELAYTSQLFSNGGNAYRQRQKISEFRNCHGTFGQNHHWWEVEPNVGRVVDGVASRVDRLKAIGNGQVPLCAATAWRILSA